VAIRLFVDEVGSSCSPPVDRWFVYVFDLVDVIKQDELWCVVRRAAVDTTFIIPDGACELLVGLELIQRVCVEREVKELLGGITSVDTVVDELVEQRGFADAATPNECEDGLIFELTAGRVWPSEMVKITFVTRRQVEGVSPAVPPRVVVVEGFDEGVASIESHQMSYLNEDHRNDCYG
jgi:hypothetical protein